MISRTGIRLETRGEIRQALEGNEIRVINFPDWVGATDGEAREIEIKLRDKELRGKVITIRATPYQTLEIEER